MEVKKSTTKSTKKAQSAQIKGYENTKTSRLLEWFCVFSPDGKENPFLR